MNNIEVTYVIVYFCPHRQYNMCVNIDPINVLAWYGLHKVACWVVPEVRGDVPDPQPTLGAQGRRKLIRRLVQNLKYGTVKK